MQPFIYQLIELNWAIIVQSKYTWVFLNQAIKHFWSFYFDLSTFRFFYTILLFLWKPFIWTFFVIVNTSNLHTPFKFIKISIDFAILFLFKFVCIPWTWRLNFMWSWIILFIIFIIMWCQHFSILVSWLVIEICFIIMLLQHVKMRRILKLNRHQVILCM